MQAPGATFDVHVVKIHPQRITDDITEGTNEDEIYFILTGLGPPQGHETSASVRSPQFTIYQSDDDIKVDWPLFTFDWKSEYYVIGVRESDSVSNDDDLGGFTIRLVNGQIDISAGSDTVWDGEKLHFRGSGARYWMWFEFRRK
jgi:hypothetical protein